jgi:hypothetical protein
MRVQFSVVGVQPQVHIEEVEMDVVPREDEVVNVMGLGQEHYVRTVVWYPFGEINGKDYPFVYVVIGKKRT